MAEFEPFGKPTKRGLVPAGAEIKDHVVPQIKDGAQVSYTQIKSRFNPELAAKSHNTRFSLSEQVANQMALEREEQVRFDRRVDEKVKVEIERLRTEAQAAGYAAGLEKGRQEAFELERARLAAQIEGTAHLIQSIEQSKEQLSSQYENTLLDVAFRIAKVVIHQEIKQRPEVVVATVAEILNRISKEDDVVIKIAKTEFEALGNIRAELSHSNRNGRVSFELDDNLKQGDCVVESASGEIASYLDDKFRKLQDALFKGTNLGAGEGPTGT